MPEADDFIRLLRQRSYAHYLSALFAPASKRNALAVIYDFQYEIIHITEQAKEPLLGEMRLQYWRDNLNNAVSGKRRSEGSKRKPYEGRDCPPLIKALSAAIAQYGLSVSPFLNLCKSAASVLYREQKQNRENFESYCADVYGAMREQICCILADGDVGNLVGERKALVHRVCFHGGAAEGIARLICGLPRNAKERKLVIPQDIIGGIGITEKQLYALAENTDANEKREMAKRLSDALCAYFYHHYRMFQQAEKRLPAFLRPAFLSLAVLPAFIKQAEKNTQLLFGGEIKVSLLRQQSRIFRAALFNSF